MLNNFMSLKVELTKLMLFLKMRIMIIILQIIVVIHLGLIVHRLQILVMF